jgi:DnaJ domain
MNIKDAFNILEISKDHVNPEEIKAAYRKATAQYHPDHNPAGLEMMKLVNVAYETLKEYEGEVKERNNQENYGEAVNEALNAIINLGLDIEVCGSWIWVRGNTYPHRRVLDDAGYKWAPKKKCWYFRPEDYMSRNRKTWSMEKIRDTYGSEPIKNEQKHLQAIY